MPLKKCDLHVHVQQSLYPEDLFLLAKDHYKEINWNRFGFLDRYKEVFGITLDPIALFDNAVKTNDLSGIEEIGCYKYKGTEGNFAEFNVKSYFCICVQGYYLDRNDYKPVLQMIVDRHKSEGLTYVEYRHGFGGSGTEWKKWHGHFARFFKDISDESFAAKYIVRLGSPSNYTDLKELLNEQPDLQDTIVGVDFSGRETPPESLREFYREVALDRKNDPYKTPDVVVHIGEDYFDKSLESAIRWCHQSALLGAKRLAHCIALGLQPDVAIIRRPNAHISESAEERIAQIKYDLEHYDALLNFGVSLNRNELILELKELERMDANQLICRTYDKQRLNDIMKRQDYVLNDLKRLNTVIEVCPTSNLCIGGIPELQYHPFMKFYNAGVNIAICTDDPGIFKSSISDEVDFIVKGYNIDCSELCNKLGDPYQFRLKKDIDTDTK